MPDVPSSANDGDDQLWLHNPNLEETLVSPSDVLQYATSSLQADVPISESLMGESISQVEGQSSLWDINQASMSSNTLDLYGSSGGLLGSSGFENGFPSPAADFSSISFPGTIDDSFNNALVNTSGALPLPNFNLEDFGLGKPHDSTFQDEDPRTPSHDPQGVNSQDISHNPSPVGYGSLPRRRSWYSRNGGKTRSTPKFIPFNNASRSQTPSNSTDPLQRWRDSPPEDEPASLLAIQNALDKMPSRPGSAEGRNNRGPYHRGTSITSVDSIGSNSSTSASSMISATSSQGVLGLSSRSASRISKTRKSANRQKDARPFCCTFCCDRFKTKYDWARHEKSLHLSLESWICAPNGGTYTSPQTGLDCCVYCDFPNPSPEHLEAHNHDACQRNEPESRAFRRKDNLIQHLRHVHLLESVPHVEHWKTSIPHVSSRCGFCDLVMSSWKERQDHLANHFRQGQTMDQWKGDHGFEPSVASLVTNSLSPYLIASESKSIVPFSATSQGTKDHFYQIQLFADSHGKGKEIPRVPEAAPEGPKLSDLPQQLTTQTFAQILTLHLGRYAQQQMKLGIIPTDEMFQKESRRICYDDEDPWNQTIADNAEWLNTFKSHHFDANNAGSHRNLNDA